MTFEFDKNAKQELLEIILNRYGYDFMNYSEASLVRRIVRFIELQKIKDFYEFKSRILNEDVFFYEFLIAITVNVTEMFRDPDFFQSLIRKVFPYLETYPYFKIWHAGCSTGEEVYSLAILLKEANLLHKAKIYATDINPTVLQKAYEGVYNIGDFKTYSQAYLKAGGKLSLSDYYTARYGMAILDRQLRHSIVFSAHNLAGDSSFNEFQLIICRNVLIYFNRKLQNHVLQLFEKSLAPLGFLALGSKETIQFSPLTQCFSSLDANQKIYRKTSDCTSK